jgi:NAD(P)-dependent dehydrogenase (short-subunit alcohol dehydrogenase family)
MLARRNSLSRMAAARDVSSVSLSKLLDLGGRVAVVTGGASGIGRACCARLAEAHAAVVIADIDLDAARTAADALAPHASAAAVDVRDEASLRELADLVVARHGRLDVWVSAAGVYPTAALAELGEAAWDEVLDVNLRGTFLGAREAARAMTAGGRGGVIVNVSSTAGYRIDAPGAAHYAASKFGVRGLTRALALELGPAGIRVLEVAPTVTLTPGLEAQRQGLEGAGFALEELGPSLPLGRVAVPDDIARVVLFCVSDLAALMTGSTLAVDAGELV